MQLYRSENAKFTCEVVGEPEPRVVWEYNGQVLGGGGGGGGAERRVDITQNDALHTLTLYNVEQSDAGLYTAAATNAAGVAKSCAQLSLLRPPDAEPERLRIESSTQVRKRNHSTK